MKKLFNTCSKCGNQGTTLAQIVPYANIVKMTASPRVPINLSFPIILWKKEKKEKFL